MFKKRLAQVCNGCFIIHKQDAGIASGSDGRGRFSRRRVTIYWAQASSYGGCESEASHLKELLDEGLISEKDYDAKKTEPLGKIP